MGKDTFAGDACRGDAAAVDGHGAAAVDASGISGGGDAAAVDGHGGGGDAVVATGGDDSACAACLAVDDEIGGFDGGAVGGGIRDGEGCAVAEDQVRVAVVEGEISADGDGVGDDVPGFLSPFAVHDIPCDIREDGVQVALALHAVRVQVGDGGHGRSQRLAREGGGAGRADVGVFAVDKDAVDGDIAAVAIVAVGVDAVGGIRPAEGDVVGVDAEAVTCCVDAATVDGDGVAAGDAEDLAYGGDGAAVDGEDVADGDAGVAVGDDSAGAVRLAVDGELVGVDGVVAGVRDGEGCAIAEDQVGVAVEVEQPADCDVGGDDVPAAAIRDAAVRVREGGVVGAYLPVAVRVDVGHEVRAERLAREDGGIDHALVDGRAVGKQLPVLDGDGAIEAVGGDAVGGVRPAEGDGEPDVDTVGATVGINGTAVDGYALGGDAVVLGCCGDAAAVDGDAVVGVDTVSAAVGGDGAGATCLAVDGEVAVGVDGFVHGGGVRGGEGCAVADDQVGVAVEECDLPVDRDGVGDDVPSFRAAFAVFDPGFGGVRDYGVVGAHLLGAARVDVRDVDPPCGGKRHDGVLGVGEVQDGRAVRVDGAVRAAPAGESVARAREGVGRERLRHVVGQGLVGHRAGVGVGSVEMDGVGDGRPVGGVGAVAVRAGGDGDGFIGCRAVAARPAVEGVAGAHGVREGDFVAVVGVGGWVGRAAAGEVAGDGVGMAGVERGKAGLVEGAAQRLVRQVLDGAALAGDVEGGGGVVGDRALECEDVRAAAGEVGERAPGGRERRRAGDRHGLAERH